MKKKILRSHKPKDEYNMSLPTTTQVTDYINTLTQPVSSKLIAKHFQCKAKDINRNRPDYIGIYSNPDVISSKVTHLHTARPRTVPPPTPIPRPRTVPPPTPTPTPRPRAVSPPTPRPMSVSPPPYTPSLTPSPPPSFLQQLNTVLATRRSAISATPSPPSPTLPTTPRIICFCSDRHRVAIPVPPSPPSPTLPVPPTPPSPTLPVPPSPPSPTLPVPPTPPPSPTLPVPPTPVLPTRRRKTYVDNKRNRQLGRVGKEY